MLKKYIYICSLCTSKYVCKTQSSTCTSAIGRTEETAESTNVPCGTYHILSVSLCVHDILFWVSTTSLRCTHESEGILCTRNHLMTSSDSSTRIANFAHGSCRITPPQEGVKARRLFLSSIALKTRQSQKGSSENRSSLSSSLSWRNWDSEIIISPEGQTVVVVVDIRTHLEP